MQVPGGSGRAWCLNSQQRAQAGQRDSLVACTQELLLQPQGWQ